MRIALVVTVMGTAVGVYAQQPAAKTFTGSTDVTAMIAKAKNERKPDQANFIQPLLQAAPYTVNLEYRVKGVDTSPNVHEQEAELFYVIEGGGTLTTGRKQERRICRCAPPCVLTSNGNTPSTPPGHTNQIPYRVVVAGSPRGSSFGLVSWAAASHSRHTGTP